MAFLSKSASFTSFTVIDSSSVEKDQIINKLNTFRFRSIDHSYDEISFGISSIMDPFDEENGTPVIDVDGVLFFSLRIDKRKISSAVLKKKLQQRYAEVMKEKQIPKISRSYKIEIKEAVTCELLRKYEPEPTIFDVSWNLNSGQLYVMSTTAFASSSIEVIFNDVLNMKVVQQVIYTIAESGLNDDDKNKLNNIASIAI